MIDMLIILLVLSFSGIFLLVIYMNHLDKRIYELKEKLEQHRIRFNYLEFDYSSISDIEERLNKLEELLELKEFYEQEPLNEK